MKKNIINNPENKIINNCSWIKMDSISESDNTKKMIPIVNKNKKISLEKEKFLRKVTTTKKWKTEEEDFIFENQIQIIKDISETLSTPPTEFVSSIPPTESLFSKKEIHKLYKSEIQNKINSYRSQDILKKLYQESLFVDFPFVIQLIFESNLDCFYCKKKVQIIYENVREPFQWSLERIDNTMGHNKDNVKIACLSCNLRRRTMYHERYIFTKQMCNIKKI